MKEWNKCVFISLVLILSISCKKEGTSSKDDTKIKERYFNLEKRGWKSLSYTQKIDDIGFTAIEIPIQYYLLKDKGIDDLFLVDSLYEENKRERVIEFTFQQDEEKDLLTESFIAMNYTDAVEYMSFKIDKDFYAVTSKKDTVLCSGSVFERNYKIAPYQKVLLFFSGIDPDETIQLVYNDRLFSKGTLKFKFKGTYTPIAL